VIPESRDDSTEIPESRDDFMKRLETTIKLPYFGRLMT
jgi:hypothetical protein